MAAAVSLRNARDAARNGIGMVFQEQSLILNMSVAENIYLGHEDEFTRLGVMNWRALRKAAARQLQKIGVERRRRRRAWRSSASRRARWSNSPRR